MKLTKSKQFLAYVIHASGKGWPDGTNWAVQNGDHGRISFSENKPARSGRASWMAKGGFKSKIEVCSPQRNWHQTILSCDEYFSAYPEPKTISSDSAVLTLTIDGVEREITPYPAGPEADTDGWIDWKGGECPVAEGDHVDFVGRNYYGSDRVAGGLDWANIMQYRLLQPVPVDPEFCESVMRSIPEPDLDDAESRLARALELVNSSAPHLLSDKYKFIGDEVMGERKPTIEQLAADYRNAKDCAERLQKEAGAAKADAEAKLAELVDAGKELDLDASPISAKQETELVITDWRGLQVGGEVKVLGSLSGKRVGEIGVVTRFDEKDMGVEVRVHFNGNEYDFEWLTKWRFIRRPQQQGDSMKEYLKMSGYFVGRVTINTDGQICDDKYFRGSTDIAEDYYRPICHAINSHDELVAEVERLTKLVEAMSLDAPQKPIFQMK